jgi:hypothetical protein
MCRNIKVLYNFAPPATEDEIHAAALQYVRKVSGFREPAKANQAAFDLAVVEIAKITAQLLNELQSGAAPRNRETEAARAKARSEKRFGESAH